MLLTASVWPLGLMRQLERRFLMGSQLPRWERMLCCIVIPVTLLLSAADVTA